jgi:hypothetical protein
MIVVSDTITLTAITINDQEKNYLKIIMSEYIFKFDGARKETHEEHR